MNYKRYSIEDLVLDKKFRKWVLDPDSETNAFWEEWLAQNPHQANIIHQARELLLDLPEVRHVYSQEREDKLWDKIVEEVKHNARSNTRRKVIPLRTVSKYRDVRKTGRHRWAFLTKGGIAASVIILSIVTAFFWAKMEAPQQTTQPVWVVKENSYGQKSTIYLSDGTEVVLNAGSQIKYSEQFPTDKRVVMLQGEAYFRVVKDTLRPFEVIANGVVTRALGTSFNIRAFPEEPVQVSLVNGKVLVRDQKEQGEGLILTPGESATSSLENPGELKKGLFDVREVLSWKDGIIYFHDADEETVFTTLERWYGVEITTLNASPKPWDYTGEVKNLSLYRFLQSLSFTMDFHYHINDKKVTIEYDE